MQLIAREHRCQVHARERLQVLQPLQQAPAVAGGRTVCGQEGASDENIGTDRLDEEAARIAACIGDGYVEPAGEGDCDQARGSLQGHGRR
jgi:hypothetical protein